MTVRLLYGDGMPAAKSLVTAHLTEILQAGGRAVLLVPEQETVSAERRMLEVLPPAAQLSFEVLNFTRLANRTFRTVGGLCYRYATPGVSILLMWQALRDVAPMLRQYGNAAANDVHLSEKLLATQQQLKAALVPSDMLLQVSDKMGNGSPLADKLSDLGTVFSTFEEALSRRFDDMTDDLVRLADVLRTHTELYRDTHFFVTSFTDFTAQEQAVLQVLIQNAASLCVALPLRAPRENDIHLASPAATEQKLRRMATEAGAEIVLETPDIPRPHTAREYLTAHLWDTVMEPAPLGFQEDGTLSLNILPSPFEEAAAAAAQIHRLVRSGCRYRDIAVVVRDASEWVGILDAAFEKEGIPYFLSQKTDVTVRPLIKLILLALRIHIYGWREEDIIEYLKTGLHGIPRNDIDLFEEYLGVWHFRNASSFATPFVRNPDGYSTEVSPRGARILEAANAVREALYAPLHTFHEALCAAEDAAACCRALYAFLGELNIVERLREQAAARLAAGERREAEELSRLWGVVVGALEEIDTAIGDKHLTPAEFSSVLHLVFARTDIGTIPTSSDEVTVGSASLLRADHPRHTLVLGLIEGGFPRTINDDGLFSDADRRRLAEDGIVIERDNATALSDELFYLYRTFSAPRERLWLSYSEEDTVGNVTKPSMVVGRIEKLFPELQKVRPDEMPLDMIYTPSAAAERYGTLPRGAHAAVSELLEKTGNAALGLLLDRPLADPLATVDEGTAGKLFSHRFSPTHLERFSSCPFAYYCERILRLRTESDGTLNSLETGTFIHYVLENVVRRGTDAKGSECEVDTLVQNAVRDYKQFLTDASGGFTPQTEALFDRLTLLAKIIVHNLFAELADSDFSPAFFELDLGAHGERPTVPLSNGSDLPLSGTTDRVDVFCKSDGKVYLRIVDYKTGSRTFDRDEIKNGQCLQMPLYLMALCGGEHPALMKELGLPPQTRFLPAGITYFSTALKKEHTPAHVEPEKAFEKAENSIKRDGALLAEEDILHAISHKGDPALIGGKKGNKNMSAEGFRSLFDDLSDAVTHITARMRRGEAHADPLTKNGRPACAYCRYRAVCRAARPEKK